MTGQRVPDCQSVREALPLFLYGELTFDEEEQIEDHVGQCGLCRAELDLVREMNSVLQRQAQDPSAVFLRNCRENLFESLERERSVVTVAAHNRWALVREKLSAVWNWHVPRPVGALALLLIGFVGARLTFDRPAVGPVPQADPIASRVRYVEPDGNGRVQIVLDETRQRVVFGGIEEAPIRQMLLAAARDAQDPGLRGETLRILNARPRESDVRQALINAMRHDSNAGVRLKALSGLKAFAQEPDVQEALAQSVLADGNPGLRAEAIDLLTEGLGKNGGQKQLVGVLQQLMRKETNGYVRMRCQRALEELNATLSSY